MVERMTFVPVILVVGLAGLVSAAQPPAADVNAPQTLAEYLRSAALHNAGLKAAFEEWKAALEQIPQAQALPDPRFTYNYFIEHVQMRQRVGLVQMFPWFGTIAARTDAAAAAAHAAQSRYEARELQLFAEVKEAFYEYVYLAAAIESTRDNLELMRHFEEVARTKYLTAAGTQPDVIRAQIEVANLENDLITREQSREPVVARLNADLNRPARAPLPWPRQEPGSLPALDRQVLLAALRQHNPELRALAFDIERLGREVTLAQKRFYPNIGLGVEWIDMSMPGMDDDVRVGLELNLPIWRRSYQAGELQARARARRTQHDRKDTENTLAARIERAAYEYEDRGRQVDLYTNVLVPRARELIGASEAAYMAGTLDFLSLIDAERMLLQFRLEQERALADRRQRLAELEMLAGRPLVVTP
jgi:cobalt-zinc-cadmium efflux system outer membrane protein